ncbi:hypothetical protein D3C75_831920 [compost metagenome]
MNIIEVLAFLVKLLVNLLQPLMPHHAVFTEDMFRIAAQSAAVFLLLLGHLPYTRDKFIYILHRPGYASMFNMHLNLQQLNADLKFVDDLMAHEDQLQREFGEPVYGSAVLFPAAAGRILVNREVLIFLHRHLPGVVIIIYRFKITAAAAPQQPVDQPFHGFGGTEPGNIEAFQRTPRQSDNIFFRPLLVRFQLQVVDLQQHAERNHFLIGLQLTEIHACTKAP